MVALWRFHEFDQHTIGLLRMDKNHERAVRANTGLAQNFGALFLHVCFGLVDIRHLETDMVLPALRVLLDELLDRAIVAQRLDELDLAVRQIDERELNALRGQLGD